MRLYAQLSNFQTTFTSHADKQAKTSGQKTPAHLLQTSYPTTFLFRCLIYCLVCRMHPAYQTDIHTEWQIPSVV